MKKGFGAPKGEQKSASVSRTRPSQKGSKTLAKRARPVRAPDGERWSSVHTILKSILGVEGAHLFDALLQDFSIDKHIYNFIASHSNSIR